MVAKCQRSDIRAPWREVFYHLPWRRYTRQQQYVAILINTVERFILTAEYRSDVPVIQTCEIQSLEGEEVHRLGDYPILHRFEVVRTLGHYHDVSPVLTAERFAQSSCRQQFVVDNQSVIINEQDVHPRFDISMLESIVEQYHVDVVIVGCQLSDAVASLSIHRHCDVVAIFAFHLQRFVAHSACRCLIVGNNKPSCASLISTTEHCHPCLVLQKFYQIFHMGSLARTAHGDVTHRDYRYVKTLTAQYAYLKEHITYLHAKTVEPAQRK